MLFIIREGLPYSKFTTLENINLPSEFVISLVRVLSKIFSSINGNLIIIKLNYGNIVSVTHIRTSVLIYRCFLNLSIIGKFGEGIAMDRLIAFG